MDRYLSGVIAAAVLAVAGCVTTGEVIYVQRVVDLSWNDLDYDYAAGDISSKMLHYVSGRASVEGRLPVIVNGPVIRLDNAPNNIDRELLMELIRAEVMRSGYAEFSFATSESRRGGDAGMLYKMLEAQNESGVFDPETVKGYGSMVSADYILFGKIFLPDNSTTWRISFSVIDVETGKGKWSDNTRIVK